LTTENTLRDLVKKIYTKKKQSVWTFTLGKKQSGKTDFSLRLMELLHEEGLADGFGSNVESLEAPFEVDFIQDYETLMTRCQMLNPNPERHGIKRYFYFCSEMGKAFPQDQPWKNAKFIAKLQIVRKIGLSWLGDGINRIDQRIVSADHFDGKFKKLSITRPDIATYHNFSNGRRSTVQGIKRTSLKFNTWETSNFYMAPQVPEDAIVPLNKEHQDVKKYLEFESWKKAGIDTKTGKRSVLKVLRFHYDHCLPHIQEPVETKAVSEPSSIEES